MIDPFGRNIDYLRISITHQCNLRCQYCIPGEGVPSGLSGKILTSGEIISVAEKAASLGFSRIRITGGEPLLRRGVVSLVSRISRIPGIRDLSLTTNGILLSRLIGPLKQAGLGRVNVSLDTLDPGRYSAITRGGDVERVISGIMAAKEAMPGKIKLNCVVEESSCEPDARAVAQFARDNGLEARFIRKMDFKEGRFWVVEGGGGGDCPRCNRLRLTCNGMLKPCLFSDISFDVRKHGIEEAFRLAVQHKPLEGGPCKNNFLHMGG
jgi:cyclic pyranopterin phosphate synthase